MPTLVARIPTLSVAMGNVWVWVVVKVKDRIPPRACVAEGELQRRAVTGIIHVVSIRVVDCF